MKQLRFREKLNFLKSLLSSPIGKDLSFFWNLGSYLGLLFIIQFFRGLILVFYYRNQTETSFSSVQYLINEVNSGWFIRLFHFNGARFFFFFIYLHILKGLIIFSYRLTKVWLTGLIIFILLIGEAFLGYVLVWAQMSFWAGIVITSLIRILPFFGKLMINFVWGSFLLGSNLLKFFFFLHFFLPFLFFFFIFFHIFFLHQYFRTSFYYFNFFLNKVGFTPYFLIKDLINIIILFISLIFIFLFPFHLGDSLMFEEVNYLVRPVHIVPEWYFLFFYAILRAIPNKILGIFFLILSIFCLFLLIFIKNNLRLIFNFNFFLIILLINIFIFLRWLGKRLVELPYILLRQSFTFFYFFLFIILINNFLLSKVFFLFFILIRIFDFKSKG